MAFRIKWRSCMTKLKFLSAALIVAATLAAPATASDRQVSSRHLAVNANASAMPGALYRDEGDRFRGYDSHDVWGHWGTYYGPMLPSIP
jgi:hypothetical protein